MLDERTLVAWSFPNIPWRLNDRHSKHRNGALASVTAPHSRTFWCTAVKADLVEWRCKGQDGKTEWWNSGGATSLALRRYVGEQEERWSMWLSGVSNDAAGGEVERVGLLTSADGEDWVRHHGDKVFGSVMDCNTEDWWWFDVAGVRVYNVTKLKSDLVLDDDSVHFMYYAGADRTRRRQIGLAISKDGIYWSRIEGEHHSGALWEYDSTNPIVVIDENGGYRMFFLRDETARSAISSNGVSWVEDAGHCNGLPFPISTFAIHQESPRYMFLCQPQTSRQVQVFLAGDNEMWSKHCDVQTEVDWQQISIIPMGGNNFRIYGVGSDRQVHVVAVCV
uniref:Glycosyl hydrolase family 32 N-terminal domain-containing protein n=1 Tax=Compsopogon caeruleus TaxID=31354 RepID=A0A7S1X8Z5_9RHOD|mmetsp:Transcript_10138/g.20483  ORF Transcript_10138/g.20483 Transcript_10138/m.20483 type:complete len:335 (+) Transcript_10138:39-1043(+)